MRRLASILALALATASTLAPQAALANAPAAPTAAINPALAAAVADPRRAEDRARDAYRHPAEMLAFFDVQPGMKVGEYAPGGGWFSRLLGLYLGPKGQLSGVFFNPLSGAFSEAAQKGIRDGALKYPADVAGWSGQPASHFSALTLDAIPDSEKGTFDRILMLRMIHNLTRWNIADSEIRAIRTLLKDGGMVGIEQHRARPDAPFSYSDGSKGYLREADVIRLMESNGFDLVARSEINANPKDPANWPDGVWTLPPTYRNGDVDRAKYAAIGESDRMTLLFRKRP